MTEHKVMLAPSKLAEITNVNYPTLVQPKYDGFRATYVPEVGFLSRTGKPFRNKRLVEYFSSLETSHIVLDGELYVAEADFADTQSLITTEDARINCKLQFRVFDAMPLADWESRSCELKYSDRLVLLREVVNSVADYTKVLDVPTDTINSSSELIKLYKKTLTSGLEGVMIKDEDGLYKWGRVGADRRVQKLKPMKTGDFVVSGIFEGKGKHVGMAGGIIMNINNNTVKAGTGFTDADRKEIFNNQNDYIGRTAEIKYMSETKDGSLRHPVFYRWRDDK